MAMAESANGLGVGGEALPALLDPSLAFTVADIIVVWL